jgi:hypothetical protein
VSKHIDLLRNLLRDRINSIESFPGNTQKDANQFQNWVNDINTTIEVLYKLGDHCFVGFPSFGFTNDFYTSSRETINERGYTALLGYLNMIKPLLSVPA